MTAIDSLLDTAQAHASASRLLADIAIGHYAEALRMLVPGAKSLSWTSGTQYDDSGYYSAIEDIDLHIEGKRKLHLGTAGELSAFPSFFEEWEDFDARAEGEESDPPEDVAEERFAAHLVETYGLMPGVDWQRIGPIVENILALRDDSDNHRSLDPKPLDATDEQRAALRSVLAPPGILAIFDP